LLFFYLANFIRHLSHRGTPELYCYIIYYRRIKIILSYDLDCSLCSVEDQVLVVGQQVVVRDATVGQGPDNSHAIGSLEVCLDDLVVATVTATEVSRTVEKQVLECRPPQTETFQFETFDSQGVDRLLTLVGEPQVVWVPSQLEPLDDGTASSDGVHQLVDQDVHAEPLLRAHHYDPETLRLFECRDCCDGYLALVRIGSTVCHKESVMWVMPDRPRPHSWCPCLHKNL
jgi:hypothetical protein